MNYKAITALAAALVVPSMAVAETFTYSAWTPPPAPNNRAGTVPMFEEITATTQGTDNELVFENFMGGQLFNAFTTLAGLRDGVIDGGILVPGYNAAELRTHTTMGELQALVTEGYAAAAAGTETLLQNCPGCLEEYAEMNVLPLGVYATAPYHLMCNFELTSMDQLQGKRSAEGNPMFNRWAAALGMSRQGLPPNEFQQALARGTVDCVFAPRDWLIAFSLADVVETIVEDVTHGVFPAVVMMAVNANTWDGMSPGRQEIMARETSHAIMRVVEAYYEDEVRGTDLALENGVNFVSLGQGYADAWAAFLENERAAVIEAADARGASGAAEAVDANLALFEEWEAIVAELDSDPEAIADRLYERAFAPLLTN
jgi:TRAP-type C4-dicarboxylate transport system substrate-binding protein